VDAEPDDTALAAAAAVLADVMTRYHTTPPEALGALVAEAAAPAGADRCTIYLQDYAQEVLLPLPPAADEGHPLLIDDTVAGAAFADEEEREEPDGDRVRLWVPMLDGTDRMGVLGVTVDASDPAARWLCRQLAALFALFLMSKGENSDHFFLARRRRSMSLPAEMQWQLLPALTVATPRVAVAGTLEPAYDVGGDAFDYAINGDLAHVAIIDAMGHGLHASQMAAVAIGSYRHSRRERHGLVETHRAMDAVLASQFGEDRFATAQLAELHLDTGELVLLNAGHPSPLLVGPDGRSRPVPCSPALPVGFGGAESPPLTTVPLEPGDRLLLFSDGVVENRTPAGEPFGEDRLREAFRRECAAGRTASETVRQLSRTFLDEHGGKTRDDATWVLIEWRGTAGG
jgi:sigma-B regulation protein RsbU (phosphoserine phosphatase)